MVNRRGVLTGFGGVAMGGLLTANLWAKPQNNKVFGGEDFADTIAKIETDNGGRLGVAIWDMADGRRFAHRGNERFPLCSTFKFILAAAILSRAEHKHISLEHRIKIRATDILHNSPITEQYVGKAMTVADLCEATIITSDNAAANLLLPLVGNPAGLTRYFRALGDNITRLDRGEPMMSTSTPGDPRDTTTPNAMIGMMRRLLIGNALSPASRQQLLHWLINNRTGDKRLRAGLPRNWKVGDKTGSGDYGSVNDVAIVWPPNRAPLLIASYITQSPAKMGISNASHAAVSRAIAEAVGN